MKVSIVLPAKNEAKNLRKFLPELVESYPESEIIVVNDGSSDDTSGVCKENGVVEYKHPYSKGNGASIKSGASVASGDVIVFMDGDGQHRVSDIAPLLGKIDSGYDMAVGARDNKSQASFGRLAANKIYNHVAGWMVGHNIPDLTSGLRAVNAKKFRSFLYMLPNGFSYPTTITMAFFKAGYSIAYVDIKAEKREGDSHINLWKDGTRFLLIIFKVGTLYSPIKIFFPFSMFLFLSGVLYYGYTYFSEGRFTNMGMLLFSTSLVVFLMGLVSEQITTLLYSKLDKE